MFKNFGLGLALILALGTVACGPANGAEPYPRVELTELVNHPENFLDKDISVEGHVTESLGERNYWLYHTYVVSELCQQDLDPEREVCLNVKSSLSEVRVGQFGFTDGENTIVVTEKTGGLYLPIPIVPAGSPNVPNGNLILKGTWRIDSDGKYQLHISGIEEKPVHKAE